jgi:hypothetical protein
MSRYDQCVITCQRLTDRLCDRTAVVALRTNRATSAATSFHCRLGGLDFLNSIAMPADTPVDWLDNGTGLLERLARAEIAPVDVLNELKACAMPGVLDDVADQTRALREWFRGFVRRHMGRPLPPGALRDLAQGPRFGTSLRDLGPLNTLLARDEAFGQIMRQRDGDRLKLEVMRRRRSAGSLLLPIGEALATLVCEQDFTAVKACQGYGCTRLFADRTRRRTRR